MLHVAFGYGLFTGGLGFHDGAERIGMTVVPVSSGNTARHHLLLQDFRPPGICGTPSFVLHIAESLTEQGGDPRALGLRYGMFGAEPWTEGLRDRARARLRPARLRHLRAERDRRARRGRRVRGARRPARLRRPLPARDHRPGHRRAAAARAGRGAGADDAHQARASRWCATAPATSRALDPEPCRCGRTTARIARIKGRTDDMLDHQGRQPLSLRGRGDAAGRARSCSRTTCWSWTAR